MPTGFSLPVAGVDPLYVAYHDDEWGVPECDDRALFEKLVARRISGRTVLDHDPAQTPRFPPAFDGFDPEKIVR